MTPDNGPSGQTAPTVPSRPPHPGGRRAPGAPSPRAGRYVLLEELGRGGMGVVWRALDPDLGRHVAVKVLLPELEEGPDAVRRFEQEARITGRLQHPGIVPVYELGRCDDGGPFLAMKLVEGRTLSQLLRCRADTGDGLPRMLAVFEQVCQTIAYAHSNGVIHRDLKPSNIMVGAFGEAQVMDWGLARELGEAAEERGITLGGGDTQTAFGRALGTPSYMPPEQTGRCPADFRSDVFGLGALLCEILTGTTPWGSGPRSEVLERVALGRISPALEALHRCGACPELVALAADCLALAPEARPANAGAVLERLTAYQQGVRQRLRTAEVERAAAEKSAHAERMARHFLVGLVGVTFLACLIGYVAWEGARTSREAVRAEQARLQQGRQAEAEAALLDASAALAEAGRLREQPVRWEATLRRGLGSVQRAKALLAELGRPEGLSGKASSLEEQLRSEDLERRVSVRLAEAHRACGAVTRTAFDLEAAPRAYEAALREFGLRPFEGHPAREGEGLRKHRMCDKLVAAAEDWAHLEMGRPARRDWLLKFAGAADPNPWRVQLRRAARGLPGQELPGLVLEARREDLTLSSLLLASSLLEARGDREGNFRVLVFACQHFPGEWRLQHMLGRAYSAGGNSAEAVRHLSIAAALRPDSPGVLLNLGAELSFLRRLEEAEQAFRRALALDGKFALAHYNLGIVLQDQHRLAESEASLRRCLQLQPNMVDAGFTLGRTAVGAGRLEDAEATLYAALCRAPNHPNGLYALALLRERQGRLPDAQALLQLAAENDRHKGARFLPDRVRVLHLMKRIPEADRLSRAVMEMRPIQPELLDRLAPGLYGHSSDELALACDRLLMAAQPGHPHAVARMSRRLIERGRHEEAAQLCRGALAVRTSWEAVRWLGAALIEADKAPQALVALREAVGLHATASLQTDLARAWLLAGQADEAEKAARAALALKADHAGAKAALAQALRRQGKLDRAAQEIAEAVRLAPNDRLVLLEAAYHHAARFGWAAALPRLSHLAEGAGPGGQVHLWVGRAFLDAGMPGKANKALRAAAAAMPESLDAHFHLGRAADLLGDRALAERSYRRATELRPEVPEPWCNLGVLLARQGQLAEGERCLAEGHRLGSATVGWPYPSGRWLLEVRAAIALKPRLADVVAGRLRPRGPRELAVWGRAAGDYLGKPALAARLYAEALHGMPELARLPGAFVRSQALHWAAVAGGKEMRRRALGWVWQEIRACRADGGPQGMNGLRRLLGLPELAPLREGQLLEKLPPEEAEEWRKAWGAARSALAERGEHQ